MIQLVEQADRQFEAVQAALVISYDPQAISQAGEEICARG